MWEGQAHWEQCHFWIGFVGLYKRASWTSDGQQSHSFTVSVALPASRFLSSLPSMTDCVSQINPFLPNCALIVGLITVTENKLDLSETLICSVLFRVIFLISETKIILFHFSSVLNRCTSLLSLINTLNYLVITGPQTPFENVKPLSVNFLLHSCIAWL